MSDRFAFGSAGLIHELEMGMDRAGDWDPALVKLLASGDHLVHVREYLRGRAEIMLQPEPMKKPEPVFDTLIRVDRSIRPTYPNWMRKVMHPELEATGPEQYSINRVEQWLYEVQKSGGVIGGNTIYKHLKKHEMLPSCLDLADLLAIQKKGRAFFRQYFQKKAVFGWKSIVQHEDDGFFSPFLHEDDCQVELNWRWLDRGWDTNLPALRFVC